MTCNLDNARRFQSRLSDGVYLFMYLFSSFLFPVFFLVRLWFVKMSIQDWNFIQFQSLSVAMSELVLLVCFSNVCPTRCWVHWPHRSSSQHVWQHAWIWRNSRWGRYRMPDIVCLRHYECPMRRLKWFNKNTLQKKKKKIWKCYTLYAMLYLYLKHNFPWLKGKKTMNAVLKLIFTLHHVTAYNHITKELWWWGNMHQ